MTTPILRSSRAYRLIDWWRRHFAIVVVALIIAFLLWIRPSHAAESVPAPTPPQRPPITEICLGAEYVGITVQRLDDGRMALPYDVWYALYLCERLDAWMAAWRLHLHRELSRRQCS